MSSEKIQKNKITEIRDKILGFFHPVQTEGMRQENNNEYKPLCRYERLRSYANKMFSPKDMVEVPRENKLTIVPKLVKK